MLRASGPRRVERVFRRQAFPCADARTIPLANAHRIGGETWKGLVLSLFGRRAWLGLTIVASLAFAVEGVSGQQKPAAEPPPPTTESIATRDGLTLKCRYFPSPADKETIPIVMLHDHHGTSADFEPLARKLQDERYGGHTIVVPDLRGHGESTQLTPTGGDKVITLDGRRMRPDDFYLILKNDLEAVKRLLLAKHNKGEVNIDKLCMVGAGMGAVLAVYFAAQDWDWPPLAGQRQGQDVKAVVLLSPPLGFKGINTLAALRHPAFQTELSVMVVYGEKDPHVASAAKRIVAAIKPLRAGASGHNPERLVEGPLPTTLQGAKLLSEAQLEVTEKIARFIHRRITMRGDAFPWQQRRHPLENGESPYF